jgi:hypothetical protein
MRQSSTSVHNILIFEGMALAPNKTEEINEKGIKAATHVARAFKKKMLRKYLPFLSIFYKVSIKLIYRGKYILKVVPLGLLSTLTLALCRSVIL